MSVPANPTFFKFLWTYCSLVLLYDNAARAVGTAFCAAFFDMVDFVAETFPVARSLKPGTIPLANSVAAAPRRADEPLMKQL
jgi:hypothetical protein